METIIDRLKTKKTHVHATIDARSNPEYYMNGINFNSEYVNKCLIKKDFYEYVAWSFYGDIEHSIINEVFGYEIPRTITKKEFKQKMSEFRKYQREIYFEESMRIV